MFIIIWRTFQPTKPTAVMRNTLAYHLNALMRTLGFKSINAQFAVSFLLIIGLASASAVLSFHGQSPAAVTAMNVGIVLIALISHQLGLTWLLRQVTLLRHHLNKLSDGDFSNPIREDASDNEVGQMFNAYNSVIDQVGSLTGGIQRLSATIHTQMETLESAAVEVDTSNRQQSHELEQAAAAMTEMSASVNEVADHAHDAVSRVETSHSELAETHSIVRDSHHRFTEFNNILQGAADVMTGLDKDTREVGKVVTVINEIAEQTNLLALNAAIEAARAGEQGRGFAVVADEVRTLAQRTQAATGDVHSIIERLQNQSARALGAMNESTRTAQESASRVAEANQALETIVAAMDDIQAMNTLIATAARQQAEVSQETDRNLGNIADLANRRSKTSADLRRATEQLHRDTSALGEQLTRIKTLS